jgi:hypothetical protein
MDADTHSVMKHNCIICELILPEMEAQNERTLKQLDAALQDRKAALAEVDERQEALLDAARQIDELKKQRNDWFERARLENEQRLDALERLRNQRPDVRQEPSRLEIAAMLMAAHVYHLGMMYPEGLTLRQACFEEADQLIAESKKSV